MTEAGTCEQALAPVVEVVEVEERVAEQAVLANVVGWEAEAEVADDSSQPSVPLLVTVLSRT